MHQQKLQGTPTFNGSLSYDSFCVTSHSTASCHGKKLIALPPILLDVNLSDSLADVNARCNNTILLNVSHGDLPIILPVILDNLSVGFETVENYSFEDQSSTIEDDITIATVVPRITRTKLLLSSIFVNVEVEAEKGSSNVVLSCSDFDLTVNGCEFSADELRASIGEAFVVHIPSSSDSDRSEDRESPTVILSVQNLVTNDGQPGIVLTRENQVLPSYRTNLSTTVTGLSFCYLHEPISQILTYFQRVYSELTERGLLLSADAPSHASIPPQPIQANAVFTNFQIVYSDDSNAPQNRRRALLLEG